MISRQRKTLFTIIAILLPFLILGLLEIILRIAGAYAPTPLFLEKGLDMQVNPRVATRYLNPQEITIPTLYPETFRKEKPSNTFRVFCLGGSTTAGFPFDAQVPFPQQLRYLLTSAYPERQFEIINLGISAMNSFTVLDLLPEVLQQSPDLLIIYMGHNEFYGIYGGASAISIGRQGWWIRSYLQLNKFRLMQMLRSWLTGSKNSSAKPTAEKTLMEQVIGDRSVAYRSDQYDLTMKNFQENLSEILSMTNSTEVPVLLSNLVANEKDLAPFGSPQKIADELRNKRTTAESLLKKEDLSGAYQLYADITTTDSTQASAWYRLGTIALQMQDSITAGKHFRLAKDYDLVRFRASEDANRIIADAAEASVFLVDMAKRFRDESRQGIPGDDLICDHLHPDPNGYYLMALTFFEEMLKNDILPEISSGFQPPPAPANITDLDWDMGLLKIHKLKHRWPFPEKTVDYKDYRPRGNPYATKAAYDYIFKHQDWVKAQYQMARFYSSRKNHSMARRHYQAVNFFFPEKHDALMQIAKLYQAEGDLPAARATYQQALSSAPGHGRYLADLAMLCWQEKRASEAITYMENALNATFGLTSDEKNNLRFYLAGFYYNEGRIEQAKETLSQLLAAQPNHRGAKALQAQIDEQLQ